MVRKVIETFEVSGLKVKIGPAMSMEGGLAVVALNIRESTWFSASAETLLAAMASTPHKTHGFTLTQA